MNQNLQEAINKNPKKIAAIAAVILVVALILLISAMLSSRSPQEPPEELLIEVPNLPPLRVIQTEKTPEGMILVKNIVDGYQITVPDNWEVEEVASVSGGLNISLDLLEEEEHRHAVEGGVLLRITTFENDQRLSTLDWLARSEAARQLFSDASFSRVDLPTGSGFKTNTRKMLDYDELPISESSKINYILGNRQRIYNIMCRTLGSEHAELVGLCEAQIQSFEIIK